MGGEGSKAEVTPAVRADLESAREECRDLQSLRLFTALQMLSLCPVGLQIRQNGRRRHERPEDKPARTGGEGSKAEVMPAVRADL